MNRVLDLRIESCVNASTHDGDAGASEDRTYMAFDYWRIRPAHPERSFPTEECPGRLSRCDGTSRPVPLENAADEWGERHRLRRERTCEARCGAVGPKVVSRITPDADRSERIQ